ncbi:hypothetical protein [Bradyrhizobium lablabi]|nr:hypothetical protein [Bradyrhizobium lablabi]
MAGQLAHNAHVDPRSRANSDPAARKIIGLANAVEPVRTGASS